LGQIEPVYTESLLIKATSMTQKLLSLVIPAYREERNISYIYGELIPVLASLSAYDYEIIFVNDGSPDHTWQEIEELCNTDERVKGVNLSRNFGKELAITAGLEHSH
jgi:glycosyltransferase involved in cell wall biosynthesis